MYYKLNKNFRLRGWAKLPFALLECTSASVSFLNKLQFETLSLCNGYVDFDSCFAMDSHRQIVLQLVKNGVVSPCEFGDDILPEQKHKVFANRYIRTVHWSVTGKCNYKCKHCYMSAPDAKLGELSYEQCMDLIEQMANCGVQEVSLTGGEPLVRKDFYDIIDKLVEKEIKIESIYSNGKLITENLLDRLEAHNLKPTIDMSFDGVGYHDWLRGMPHAEDAVNRAFALCAQRGFRTRSELCLHKKNRHVFRESLNHLAELGVSSVKVNPVALTESWAQYDKDYSLSMEEALEIYLDYIPHYFQDDMPIGLMLGGVFLGYKGRENYTIPAMKFDGEKETCESQTVCGHARHVMYLSPESRMLPCMGISAYDVQYDYPLATEIGLQNGLNDSVYLSLIETRIVDYFQHNPECKACEHKYFCAGGCRAGALVDGNTDILAKDPAFCLIHKGGYIQRVKDAAEKGLSARSNGGKTVK